MAAACGRHLKLNAHRGVPTPDTPRPSCILSEPTQLGLGLGQTPSGNSNLFPQTCRLSGDRQIGIMGDLAELVCPGPSRLSWTLPMGRKGECGRWPDRPSPNVSPQTVLLIASSLPAIAGSSGNLGAIDA